MRSAPHPDWVVPDWPAAKRVRSLITTRAGGVSSGMFANLNLSARVGDDPGCVARNRAILEACLPAEPVWMKQVHGTAVTDGPPLNRASKSLIRRALCSMRDSSLRS